MKVRKINPKLAVPWILTKHYARRLPMILHAFGLIEDKKIIGICTFGLTANSNMSQKTFKWPVLELNRLCLDTSTKNAASFLVGNSLKLLNAPLLVISYADTNVNHVGYIYQATNWIYTGFSAATATQMINGKEHHTRSIGSKYGTHSIVKLKEKFNLDVKYIPKKPKHRYFYIIAQSKKEKLEMQNFIKEHFGIFPYPKGESKKYDINKPNESKFKGFGF